MKIVELLEHISKIVDDLDIRINKQPEIILYCDDCTSSFTIADVYLNRDGNIVISNTKR